MSGGRGCFLVIIYLCLGFVVLGSIHVLRLTWGEQDLEEGQITQIQARAQELWALPHGTCVVRHEEERQTAYVCLGCGQGGAGSRLCERLVNCQEFGLDLYNGPRERLWQWEWLIESEIFPRGSENYHICLDQFLQQR
jgi:hypothetical protein